MSLLKIFRKSSRRSKRSSISIADGDDKSVNDFNKDEDGESSSADYDGTKYLSPKEAFEKFDTDSSGDIDEDEFFHLLETVGIKGKLEYQEKLFRRYLKSGSKTIDYDGFKRAWILLGNPKQELIDREVKDIPKFATRYQLVKLLEHTIDEEERINALTKAEEARYRRIQDLKSLRLEYIRKAKHRSGLELGAALDAGGTMYVLGTGTYGQFAGTPKKDMSTSTFHLDGMDLLQSLWEERVESKGNLANSNTAGIWGRQPRKVVLSDNTILALTDSGILTWGGASQWNTVDETESELLKHSGSRQLTTPRSSSLLMNNERTHRKHMSIIEEELNEKDAKSVFEIDQMELVLKYYGNWPTHFDDTNDVNMVRDHLVNSITIDQFLQSLLFRGKPCEGRGLSKLEMADMLAKDIRLELELLGEDGQQELCDIECEIGDLIKRKKTKTANHLRLRFSEKWAPLRVEQQKRAIADEKRLSDERRNNRNSQDESFETWNAKRSMELDRPPITKNRGLMAGSITTRGSDIQTPRGPSYCLDIAAGSNHAALIVRDERSRGSLYTWGTNCVGRLGQGNEIDSNYPNIVDELKGTSIVNVSCGQSHSAAVSSGGTLFIWGASSSGKLGFGPLEDDEQQGYVCTLPTRLLIPSCKVVKVSCGAAHTACIGKAGELYVWGAGDGGRLGLGPDRMGIHDTPKLVESLRHEKIVDVSCGTSTTLVLTVSEDEGTNSRTNVRRRKGGKLFVAGQKNILGASFPTFSELDCLKQNPIVIKSISAGYSHSAFVSDAGEMYCWGHNKHGCCGRDERKHKFISEPTKVESLYEAPTNLALGKQCRLSTIYKDSEGLSAKNAVDGNVNGNDTVHLAHTQFEANPFFEVDLGSFVHITNVRLWNRTEESNDSALAVDFFSKRLFPCYIMISQHPFPEDARGKEGLDACLEKSVAMVRLVHDRRMSNWEVPPFSVGRYVRIQLESSSFLHFAQLEVFGHEKRSHGPITSCSAGKFVTAAVVGSSEMDKNGNIEAAYKRAVSADW